MTDKPSSPFAGLDTSLLRSTKQQETPAVPATPVDRDVEPARAEVSAEAPRKPRAPARQARKQSGNEPGEQASNSASKQDSMLAQQNETIARIRKTVRTPGKEVSFVRLTPEEKQQLADIVYSYKRQGKKTSENEINRIAINCLLEDYQANGEQSMLARVIEALLA